MTVKQIGKLSKGPKPLLRVVFIFMLFFICVNLHLQKKKIKNNIELLKTFKIVQH